MKKIILLFIMCSSFSSISSAQTLIEQIEHAYNALDSAIYIDNLILSYGKSLDELEKETHKTCLQLARSNGDSAKVAVERNRLDSLYSVYKSLNVLKTRKFEKEVKSGNPLYVLNLKLDNERVLRVDTGKLNFNLFYFDNTYKGGLYVYCYNGEYSWQDCGFGSCSKIHKRNVPKVFRKIMRKHPKYLLFCPDLGDMNIIFYVLDDTVYVYKIIQMKEYTLDEYLKTNTLAHYSQHRDL